MHIGANNLPQVVTQLCPGGNWTLNILIAIQRLNAMPLRHPWAELMNMYNYVNLL